MAKQITGIRYTRDRSGYRIVAPYTAEKYPGKPRCWLIYGRRAGVSATVLCRACNLQFRTKREAQAFIAEHGFSV